MDRREREVVFSEHLVALHKRSHLIPSTTLTGMYYYLCFADKKKLEFKEAK